MKCKKHPRYKAIRLPTSLCKDCLKVFINKRPDAGIYLAGPIKDCSDSECRDWREYIEYELKDYYKFLNPMTGL